MAANIEDTGMPLYEAPSLHCAKALNATVSVFAALSVAHLKKDEIQKIHTGITALMLNPNLQTLVMGAMPVQTAEGNAFSVEITGFHVATVLRRILELTGQIHDDLRGFTDVKV